MKTAILALTIFVTTNGKQIKLSPAQISQLVTYSSLNVKRTIAGCKDGCQIRNTESADQIFKFLGK